MTKQAKSAFEIPNISDSLRNDYFEKGMSLQYVAEELHKAGHTNFINLEHARTMLGLNKPIFLSGLA
jgi:hypothetical protein